MSPEAITGIGGGPYSTECVEGVFSEISDYSRLH
jgi:hypothetical protein